MGAENTKIVCSESKLNDNGLELVPLIEPPVKQQCRKNKRNDIQLLRFLAIAAVLGFHLRPKSIPQGYLGVDIFFVLSGYLMTVVTSSTHGAITIATVSRFYERRLKRLCPVYLLTVFLTLTAGSILLLPTDFTSLQSDGAWALAFGSNIEAMLKHDDYFKFGSDYKFLLHTWSLCVEMQFYAMTPFILAIIARSNRPLVMNSVFILLSLAFQSFVSSPIWRFECVISRVWQFLIGTAVFYVEKNYDASKKTLSNTKTLACTVMLITLLSTPKLSQTVIYKIAIRILATFLTALIMYYATNIDKVKILKPVTQVLTLIGDASYSIYLIHWPMIQFAEYVDIFNSLNIYIHVSCILLFAFFQYYVFEKPLISVTTVRVFVICVIFYFLAGTFLVLPINKGLKGTAITTNVSLIKMDPILGNLKIADDCRIDRLIASLHCERVAELDVIVPKTKTPWSTFCGIKGNGNLTIFVTGNSYALYQVKAVQNALEGQFKMLYLAARPSCLAFDGMNKVSPPHYGCNEIVGLTDKILEALKPDIMIIIQRFDHNSYFISGKIGNTTTVQYLQNVFSNYSKHTKKIFVVEPNAIVNYNVPNALAKALKFKRPIDGISITLKEHKKRIDHSMNQVVAAMKSCTKCQTIWIRQQICNAEKCYLYDRKTKLALYCDIAHMSTVGDDNIIPALRAGFKKGLQDLRSF